MKNIGTETTIMSEIFPVNRNCELFPTVFLAAFWETFTKLRHLLIKSNVCLKTNHNVCLKTIINRGENKETECSENLLFCVV